MLTHNCQTWIKVATKYVDGEYLHQRTNYHLLSTYLLPILTYLFTHSKAETPSTCPRGLHTCTWHKCTLVAFSMIKI